MLNGKEEQSTQPGDDDGDAQFVEWFMNFVRQEQERMSCVVAKVLGDRGAAEDLCQEVLAKVWSRRARLRTVENKKAWTYKVALMEARDRWRKAVRTGEEPYGLSPEHDRPVVPDLTTHCVAERVLAGLPERIRFAFLLRDLARFSSTEVGALMNVPAGTVRSWVSQAKTALQAALADTEERTSQ